VAGEAGVPLSQIHYHFGGMKGLVLALLEHENEQLLARQRRMYGADEPLWKRYEQACDFLEDDLDSGYVRTLQELTAAGWSDAEVATRVRAALDGWRRTLADVAADAEADVGGYGPLTADQVGDLVCFAFLGAESVLLLDDAEVASRAEIVGTLRAVGHLIRTLEEDRA
jgi:AcrR family transcriptional regulator